MKLNIWRILLGSTLSAITGIIGIAMWAIDHNDYYLAKFGLAILFTTCVICCGWILYAVSKVFKSIERTLKDMQIIKDELVITRELIKEYQHLTPMDEDGSVDIFLSKYDKNN